MKQEVTTDMLRKESSCNESAEKQGRVKEQQRTKAKNRNSHKYGIY